MFLEILLIQILLSQNCTDPNSPTFYHQKFVDGLCVPCHFSQRFCSTTPLQCNQFYHLSGNKCVENPENCIQYSNEQCIKCIDSYQVIGGICSQCEEGQNLLIRFLKCDYSNPRECKENEGYFKFGDKCLKCGKNCKKCSNSFECQQCYNWYKLQDKKCQNFCRNCYICNQNSCIQCAYKKSSIYNNCNPCKSNQIFYDSCILNILGCIYCQMESGGKCTQCSQCQPGWYLKQKACMRGSSLLCAEAKGYYFSHCISCSQYSFKSDNYCIPKTFIQSKQYTYINPNLNRQRYFSQSFSQNPLIIIKNEGLSVVLPLKRPYYQIQVVAELYFFQDITQNQKIYFRIAYLSYSATIDTTVQYPINIQVNPGQDFHYVYKFKIKNVQSINTNQLNITFYRVSGYQYLGLRQVILIGSVCGVQSCGKCLGKTDCQKCLGGKYLSSNQCLDKCEQGLLAVHDLKECYINQCPDGYFIIRAQLSCQICQNNCKTCTSKTFCLSCSNNTYLINNTCKSNCQQDQTTYKNDIFWECTSCKSPCKTCIDADNCNSCAQGFLNISSKRCVYQCARQFYADVSLLECKPCDKQVAFCKTCIVQASTCLSCIGTGLLYIDKKCYERDVKSCPQGYYAKKAILDKSQSFVCQKCQNPCKQCSIQANNCTECLFGYLHQNRCFSSFKDLCADNKYYQPTDKQCKDCHQNCLKCVSQTKCSECKNGFFLTQSQCKSNCNKQAGEWANNQSGRCEICKKPCKTCQSDGTSCQSCIIGFLFKKQCLLTCPQGTFLRQNNSVMMCQDCNKYQCLTCIDLNKCLSCDPQKENKYFNQYDQNCIGGCQADSFQFRRTILGKTAYFCSKCSTPCQRCQENKNKCLSCLGDQLYLIQDYNSCVNNCPEGYFNQVSNKKCQKCQAKCQICTKDNCLLCKNNFYMKQKDCVQMTQCQQSTFPNNLTRKCEECSNSCSTCKSFSFCLTCKNDDVYFVGSCLSNCPPGTFKQNKICQKCSQNCKNCISASICNQCSNNYYKKSDGSCGTTCNQEYYKDASINQCKKCQSPCRQCSYINMCINCMQGFLFVEKTSACVRNCLSGYYKNDTLKKCLSCPSKCIQCKNQTHCTQCPTLTYLPPQVNQTQNCIKQCPVFYYQDVTQNKCLRCVSPCHDCQSINKCKNCTQSTYFFKGFCRSVCPKGTYSNKQNLRCDICNPTLNCLQCTSLTKCISCKQQFIENSGQCISIDQGCPQGKYPLSNSNFNLYCQACPNYCQTCKNQQICLSCKQDSDLNLLQGTSCVKNCSRNYFREKNTCIICQKGCLSCSGKEQCFQCEQSFLLDGTCMISCPDTHYQETLLKKCTKCLTPCKTCSDKFTCKSCIQNHYLYDQKYCFQGPCPAERYLDYQKQSCVFQCQSEAFIDIKNRICYKKCPTSFYALIDNNDKQCLQKCPPNYYISSKIQCQRCNQQICSQLLNFTIKILPYYQSIRLFVIFSQEVQIFEVDKLNQFQIQLQQMQVNNLGDKRQSLQRILTQVQIQVLSIGNKHMQIQIKGIQQIRQKLLIFRFIQPYTFLKKKNDGMVLQNLQAQKSILYYTRFTDGEVQLGEIFYLVGFVFTVIIIVLLFVNIFLDNLASIYLLIELAQFLYFLILLEVYYQPLFSQFIKPFHLLNFSFFPNIFKIFGVDPSWQLIQSPPKFIIHHEDINYFRGTGHIWTFILIWLIIYVIVAITTQVCKRFFPNVNTFKIIFSRFRWSYLNDLIWIIFFNLGIFSFSQLLSFGQPSSSLAGTILSIITITLLLCYILLVIYLLYRYSIKAQKKDDMVTFFWKYKLENDPPERDHKDQDQEQQIAPKKMSEAIRMLVELFQNKPENVQQLFKAMYLPMISMLQPLNRYVRKLAICLTMGFFSISPTFTLSLSFLISLCSIMTMYLHRQAIENRVYYCMNVMQIGTTIILVDLFFVRISNGQGSISALVICIIVLTFGISWGIYQIYRHAMHLRENFKRQAKIEARYIQNKQWMQQQCKRRNQQLKVFDQVNNDDIDPNIVPIKRAVRSQSSSQIQRKQHKQQMQY